MNDERCFLELETWQNVFRSAVVETGALSDSSGIVVSLWTVLCPIPSLFKDVQSSICSFTGTDWRAIGSLLTRARDIRAMLLQWHTKYEELSSSVTSSEQSGDGKHHETLGVYMANLIIINRLSVSLDTLAGSDFELEAQALALQILELERKASTTNPRASLFMAFKAIVAQATLDTKDEWQQAIFFSIEENFSAHSVISSQVFEHWVSLKGRKITSLGTATTQR